MEKIIINGGNQLKGEVYITGAKNAALGILPATVLASDKFVIENIPDIQDIRNYISILKKLGAKVRKSGTKLTIDTSTIGEYDSGEIAEESTKMRASYYLLGALLGRDGKVELPLPGGCQIGARPIDQHIKGMKALGADVDVKASIKVSADELIGNTIYLDVVSVGATINIILAAVKAKGKTTLENAAKEPHVVDIANFLNLMGADIRGAGTDVIKINGVEELHGCEYSVVPDQITAGTYMIAAAATEGDVLIKNVIPKHLDSIGAKLIEMGAEVIDYEDEAAVRVIGKKDVQPCQVKTIPYPGFPTDLQQPMGLMMCLANGVSTITESIFENRFGYVSELQKMGADIKVNGNTAIFQGPMKLYGTRIDATDLRAGAAMILAGLVAEGQTEIHELEHIDRGYENIEQNFANLGADIKRVKAKE